MADDVVIARRAGERIRGLLGRSHLDVGQALVIEPCKQVHTFGMGFPIDVVFVDRDWKVVSLARELQPWRITRVVWRARRAVELPAGAASEVRVGDRLVLEG